MTGILSNLSAVQGEASAFVARLRRAEAELPEEMTGADPGGHWPVGTA